MEAYGYVGDTDCYQIRETDYLEILKQILLHHGKSEMAEIVAVLKATLLVEDEDTIGQDAE